MTKRRNSQIEAPFDKRDPGSTSRKRRKLWSIVLVATFIVMSLVLLGWWRSTASSDVGIAGKTFAARRGRLVITVTESGTVKARHTIDIRSEVWREGTIIRLVPEGTHITQEDVDAGKILVELDSSSSVDRLKEEEKGLASDEATLTEAMENYHIQRNQNESDITAAKLAVQFGLLDLQNYLGKTVAQRLLEELAFDPNEMIEIATLAEFLAEPNNLGGEALQLQKKYENDTLLVQGQLDKATDIFEGTQKLHDANYASALDLKSAQLDVERYRVDKDSAEEALRLFKLYTLPKQALNLLSIYREAGHELRRTEARARSMMAQVLARRSNAEEDVIESREDVQRCKEQVAACTIRAPAPGLVVYSSSSETRGFEERGPIQEGGKVYQRQKIISLPNTAEMIAEVSVHETSVDKVRPGQDATIIAEPFPDQIFRGKVLNVAPLPDPQRSYLSPDIKVYKTKVSIEDSQASLRPGMSAKVEIMVDRLEDVLMVPIQVVANRDGRKVCYVATDSGPRERQVETGAFNDNFVEIVAGLEPGENVLLNPPRIIQPESGPGSQNSVPGLAAE